ncbi:MAG: branched-chain amino acid ABC transporter substrate-binding protein [Betaproteobacteria bacterium]|nr:MAG: branched-chain amino acid ABC transporter substrate-binding protein [Betaproteobacteria bacterium]
MRRLSIRSVLHAFLSAAATTLLLGALAGCDHAPSVIKIGVAQPLSGSIGAQGQDMLNGAQLAVDEINAGGGVRIGSARARLEIVSADDKADAEAGKVAAQRLVEADVLVALANLNSGVSIAAAPIYAQANIPQLAISTKPSYTQLQLATTLRLVANDDLQSRAIGSFAAQLPGAERFAVIDDATPYGKGLADAVAADVARAGKKVPLRLSLDNSRIDFTPQMAELRDTSSDVIVAILSDFQVEALVQQLAKAGLQRMRIVGGDTLKTDKLLHSAGVVQAIFATSPILEAREFPNGPAFLEKFRKRFNGEPVYGAHYAYDAVHLVADAITRNGSVDRAHLLQRLKTFDGAAPVTGSMRFRDDGEQRYGAIAVYELRAGKWLPLMRSDRW